MRTAELRERAAAIPLTKTRMQFVARDAAGDELAFLSFDLWPRRDFLVLYELWVVRSRRGSGVGTAALNVALGIARDIGHARLLVLPRPVDDGMTERRLRAWYRRRGFTPWPDQRGMLHRSVDGG